MDEKRFTEAPLLEEYNASEPQPVSASPTRRPVDHWLQLALVSTATLVVGIFIGRYFSGEGSKAGLLLPAGTNPTTFAHNLTFTQVPNEESEAAWASIIPVGRGFIHNEALAPFVSNIAVFHQLHCLHAIVVAYYDALERPAVTNLTLIQDFHEATQTRIAIPHIRHCFDYIRQSAMCASDTNLEVLNPETRTTSGWHQPKMCRPYDRIFEFAEKWANSSDTGIVT